jgi:O-antigen polymerase
MKQANKLANSISDLKFFLVGIVVFICSLFPLRTYDSFVGLSQIDVIAPVFFALAIALFFLFVGEIIFAKNYTMRLTAADILVMAYMLYIGVRFALQHTTVNPETFFEFITLVILYLIFRNVKPKYVKYILLFFPLVGIAQIIYGIANQTQYFMPGYGLVDVTGVFNNTGIMGGFMAVVFVATLCLPIKNTDSSKFIHRIPVMKILRFVFLFLFFIQLLASHSRAAWCGSLAGCGYVIFFRSEGIYPRFVRKNSFRKLLMGVSISLLIIVLIVGLYAVRKDSADGRLLIWRISLDIIKDKPVFGYGINGFQANYMEYQARYFTSHPTSSFSNLADNNGFAFNEELKLLVEQGIMGLLLLGALVYILLFKNQENSPEITAIKATLVALFAFGCFSYPSDVFQLNVILVVLIALLNSISSSTPLLKKKGVNRWTLRLPIASFFKRQPRIGKVAITVGLLLFYGIIIILTSSVLRYNAACNDWKKGLTLFNDQRGIKLLQSCYPTLSNNGLFLSNYGKLLTLSGAYPAAIPVLQKANILQPLANNYTELGKCYWATGNTAGARGSWNTASRMIPELFTPLYLIVKMDYETGELPEARNLARQLLDKKPKIRSQETDSIQAEMAQLIDAIQ